MSVFCRKNSSEQLAEVDVFSGSLRSYSNAAGLVEFERTTTQFQ